METVYIVIIGILFILAISDLIVGVSNDAVNFLNSAIGAKVASFRTIMIIAALGVLAGAVFSSGMMEVARKGIFNPSMFYFSEIMLIFLAVMITDVILLDKFNSMGMPTSTTVSIVFELLGAAVGMAAIKLAWGSPESLLPIKQFMVDNNMLRDISSDINVADFINTSKALAIIAGIFLSVLVAFSVGALVQYLARIVFSFNYKIRIKWFGAIWGGLAFSIITFFIFIKGAKGASFMTADIKEWFQANTWIILAISFVGWTLLLQFLHWIFKLNILKLVVMVGTFSLAMAFAGNDLVNFIGVPLAGYSSFREWMANPGVDPDNLLMVAMSGKVVTPTLFLLLAGLIMVVTLFFSRKAKSVVKTSLDLSRQHVGEERFQPTIISRSIVRSAMNVNNVLGKVVPSSVSGWISKQFEPLKVEPYKNADEIPAFDLIRASVNLVVASVLIAFGTSLKLPLSTTYVTFMVAMGTSLADNAWGRESAVYRVSGVIAVIGGWFLTAFSAFMVAFILVGILKVGGFVAIIVIVSLTAIMAYKSHLSHKKKNQLSKVEDDEIENLTDHTIVEKSATTIAKNLEIVEVQLKTVIKNLDKENLKGLKASRKEIAAVTSRTKYLKDNLGVILEKLRDDSDNDFYFVQVLDYLREIMHNATFIIKPSIVHVDNNHKPLLKEQIDELTNICKLSSELSQKIVLSIKEPAQADEEAILKAQSNLKDIFNKYTKNQFRRLKSAKVGTKNSVLYLHIIDEWKNMSLHLVNLYKSYRDFADYHSTK
jgi:phosphate/sulfate permease